MSLRRLPLAIPPLPEALTPATARPVATQRVAVVISPPILRLPRARGGSSPLPTPAAGSCLVCSLAGGAAAAFVSCPPRALGLFPIRQSPVLPTDPCLSPPRPPPRPHLKSSPRGQGCRQLRKRRAGREPARPAVSANKVAFTNEQEDPIIMVLIIANIVTGLALKTSKSSSVNPRVYLFIPPLPLPEVN